MLLDRGGGAHARQPVLRASALKTMIIALSVLSACNSPTSPSPPAAKPSTNTTAAPAEPAKPAPAPQETAPAQPTTAPTKQDHDRSGMPTKAGPKVSKPRAQDSRPGKDPGPATPATPPAKKKPAADTPKAADRLEKTPGTPETPVQSEADAKGGRDAAEPTAPNPCKRPEQSDVPVIDDTRKLLEEQTCGAALWLDGLFAEKGDIDAAKRTRGYLEITNVYSQFGGFNSRTRLHIEYDLPTLENRLSAFVGRENDEDFVRGRTENAELRSTFPALGNDNKWLLGLGYSLPSTKNLQTQVRVGVRGLAPPTAFAQGRLRYTLYSDDNDVSYIRTTPFWNTRDGFGFTQSFDYSHILSRKHLLRWFTVGTISERTVGLNWRNSLILYQNLEHKRGLAYEAFIRGETDNPEPLYEYGARVLLRHPLLSERLFLEWSTGYSFPRTDPEKPRDGSYNVGLSIELPYGEVDE